MWNPVTHQDLSSIAGNHGHELSNTLNHGLSNRATPDQAPDERGQVLIRHGLCILKLVNVASYSKR